MRKVTVLKVGRTGSDYDLYIPAGTSGRDIEIGLAQAIKGVSDHQKKIDPNFKTKTLIRGIELWVEQLDEKQ